MCVMNRYNFSGSQLISNTSMACPSDSAFFTCTVVDIALRWELTPPPRSSVSDASVQVLFVKSELVQTINIVSFGKEGFMFQAVLTENRNGILTSTLTSLTDRDLSTGRKQCDL